MSVSPPSSIDAARGVVLRAYGHAHAYHAGSGEWRVVGWPFGRELGAGPSPLQAWVIACLTVENEAAR